MNNDFPQIAHVMERIQETPSIFTLRIRFNDDAIQNNYRFAPGQFNMLYLHGVGEVPISISSDPDNSEYFDHTIRVVGRVTNGLNQLQKGDNLGIRGAFGRSWPLDTAKGKDVILLTGGLGCAPVVSVIRYVTRRRSDYGHLNIMQGVKRADDLIWHDQYAEWQKLENTNVILAASEEKSLGVHWHTGYVTNLFDKAEFNPDNVIVMMCGPEPMMRAAIAPLSAQGVSHEQIWLSMERNMQCATGHCGHCQYGPNFVCKNGPVFCYQDIKSLFGVPGY